jgi:hypothetical protein
MASGKPGAVQCADDQEATQKAKQLLGDTDIEGRDIEVWDGPRFVLGVKAKGRK